MHRLPLALLVVFALVLAAPAGALASDFVVTSTGDAGDSNLADGFCDGSGACTLRAAIQQVNADGDAASTISFGPAFNGEAGDKITIGSSLPAILFPTAIQGCPTALDPVKPCAEVGFATSTNSVILNFHAVDDSSLSGVALTNGGSALSLTAIGAGVGDTTKNFQLTNSWLGVHLDTTAGANAVGLFLSGDHVDNAQIGGATAADRNVISNNTVTGIDIENADGTVILGNYIGTQPNGTTPAGNGVATSEGENIEITSGAQSTSIGPAAMDAASVSSSACDGGCNVVAAAGAGQNNRPQIDLYGESGETSAPAPYELTIRGNYIGMDASGQALNGALGNGSASISVGAADNVTIGGPSDSDMNRLNGSVFGITSQSSADGLVVRNNQFNLNFAGTEPSGLRFGGTASSINGGGSPQPVFTENRIAVSPTYSHTAINMSNGHGTVTDNVIGVGPAGEQFAGGAVGIKMSNNFGTGRSLVSGNIIRNLSSSNEPAEVAGIVISGGDDVDVFGNTIGAASDPDVAGDGIRIVQGGGPAVSEDNVIGGELASDQNSIHVSGTPIEVSDPAAVGNTFGRNVGSGGAGLPFIDLGADGPGNTGTANGGIDEPTITVAGAGFAGGTAGPGAVVRVFTRPSVNAVTTYLGKATADVNGTWRVNYGSPVANQALVAATQTDNSGSTSELSTSVASDAAGPPAPTITSGPSGPTNDATPSFAFTANEAGGSLLCSLDGGPEQPCNAGTFTAGTALADGAHTFRVVHEDVAENQSAAAVRSFTVDTQVAAPRISGPSGLIRDATPTFRFSGESGATFACTVDGSPVACAAVFTPERLADGAHRITVTQTDAAGNVSDPVARSFRVDATAPQTIGVARRNSPFDRTPTFRFRSSEAGSTFQCRVDRGRYRSCRWPYTTKRLAIGSHVLRVRAIDRAGNVDRTPLVRRFRVQPRPAA